jgi:hypothetical protein
MTNSLKNLLVLTICAGCLTSLDAQAQNQPNPEVEEFLRDQLRKVDRWGIVQLMATESKIDRQQKRRAITSTNPAELASLSEDEDSGVRFHVGANQNTPLDVSMVLAEDPLPVVRSGVATSLNFNPLASPTVQSLVIAMATNLANDPAPLVRLALAENHNVPMTVFEILARDSDFVIRQLVAENLICSRDALDLLAQDSVMVVQIQALWHPNVPASRLREASGSADPSVRKATAQNVNTPLDVLRELAKDPDPAIRRTVAEQSKTPPDVLDSLAGDPDIEVLKAVASHVSTSRDVLMALAYDKRDKDLRLKAHERLKPLLRREIKEDILERWTQ